jgi:hypothetical protein
MSDQKIVRIEVHYEDGRKFYADGDEANQVWCALESSIVMEAIHGRPYTGPQLKEVEPAAEPREP